MSEREQQGTDGSAGSRAGSRTVEDLLTYLARGLVDHPEEVVVERFDEEQETILLELSVAEDDYGKVIGRGGRTAQALRTVLRASADAQGHRVLLDIVD
ncbi:MAG TPA: KH domain-containing protein [Solirubrobacteraceae bacterium]|nr:KH domain-containing protein [Solirubrobacteraceae bacterium]